MADLTMKLTLRVAEPINHNLRGAKIVSHSFEIVPCTRNEVLIEFLR